MSPLDSSQNVMKKCSNPEHPHCTFWVLPGDTVCAGNHPQAMTLIVDGLGRRSAFFRKNGFFVDCVAPELAAFPEGWTERLSPFHTKRTGGVTGWCVELHDVVASKLVAGRAKDLNYVRALFTAKLIRPLILESRVATLPVNSSHRGEILVLIKQLVREARARRKKEQP